MKRIVLDMDPGIDDAIVLILALNNPKLTLAGVTTVSGNVNVHKGTANALRIIEALSKSVPVYMGAGKPMKRKLAMRAENFHGTDGLGNSGLSLPRRVAEKTAAVKWMSNLLKTSRKKEICIVATGPLTNVAMLLEREPDLSKKLEKIFIMGGLYDQQFRGNVTEHSEFNFYIDPHAADIVMKSPIREWPDITVAGLEVTSNRRCAVDSRILRKIRAIGTGPSDLACKILCWPVSKYSYFNLHDVFALFALLHPNMFKFEKCAVQVTTSGKFVGRCTTSSENATLNVCRKVVPAKFIQSVLEGFR